jgi:hypothetical protein
MTVKIPLRLQGIDLRDPEAYSRIDDELDELFWTCNGAVSLAVLLSDDPASVAIAGAVDWASQIAQFMPGVFVAEVHDELVSISDIASRASVAHEAVRLWTTGRRRASFRPFPAPRQVVGTGSGGKSMNLYAWREVLSWIRDVLGTDPDEGVIYLTDREHSILNAQLAEAREEFCWDVSDNRVASAESGHLLRSEKAVPRAACEAEADPGRTSVQYPMHAKK